MWTVLKFACWFRFTFRFCVCLDLTFSIFRFSLDHFSCVACFCFIGFSFFSAKPRDWLGRTSPKWHILFGVGTQHINLIKQHHFVTSSRNQTLITTTSRYVINSCTDIDTYPALEDESPMISVHFSCRNDVLWLLKYRIYLLFGSKLGYGRIFYSFYKPTRRFGGVHAFGYNSAESEPIWMKSGTHGGHCWWLALTDFGRDSRSSDSLTGRRNFLSGK